MKKFLLGLPIVLAMPVLTMAQSDFDGTWRIDLNKSAMPDKPVSFSVQGGNYQCKTCKAVKVARLMVDPGDTKTMEMIVTDNLRGTTTVFLAHKK